MSKFNKAIIASAVFAATAGLAFANGGTYVPPAAHHDGSFYAGVGVSRDFTRYEINTHDHDGRVDVGDSGWDGHLYAGYGMTFQDHYYLGGEVFGAYSSNKVGVPGDDMRLKYSFGISLLPGVKLSDSTMLYTRIGWVNSKFEGPGFDRSRNGVQLGVGFETMVANNVSARLEYDWARYQRFSAAGFGAGARPEVNVVNLDVSYHFMAA